jgi:hypothetical protein
MVDRHHPDAHGSRVVINRKDHHRPKPGDRHSMEYGRDNTMSRHRPKPAPQASQREAEDATVKWLEDAPARSADALAALGHGGGNGGGGSSSSPFEWPTTAQQLADCLNTAASEHRVAMLDPRVHVEVDRTILVQQQSSWGTTWGVNGNHAKLQWVGPGGADVLVYQGVNGVSNRGLFIEKLNIDGNGYAGAPAGFGVKVYAPEGDPGSIYKFTLRDLFVTYAEYGFGLVGAVFEGMCENCHAENCTKDGMLMQSTGLDGGAPWSIVSNIQLIHPNMSRNLGAGVRAVNSTNALMGSFILNGEGGIVAPDGLRAAFGNNGENTGESLFVVQYAGWGSLVNGNEASTDGSTHCRKFENGEWVSVGKPMKYLLDNVVKDVPQTFNHVSYYGDPAHADEIAVIKP